MKLYTAKTASFPVVIFCLLIIHKSPAQSTFSKTYDIADSYDEILTIVKKDSNYILIGNGTENSDTYGRFVVKFTEIDAEGNLLWKKQYKIDSLDLFPD